MIDPLNPRSLESARKAAGLSRSDLADLAQVDETTILRIENGRSDPRLDATWAPIVRALQSSVPKAVMPIGRCQRCDEVVTPGDVATCGNNCPMRAKAAA